MQAQQPVSVGSVTATDAQIELKVESFAHEIFGGAEGFEKIKNDYRDLPQPLCAKSISEGELSYKCYDCGEDNDYHILCESCFSNGEHKGHRYLRSLERGGCCDCGDTDALGSVGFCLKHPGFACLSIENLNIDEQWCQNLELKFVEKFDVVLNACEDFRSASDPLDKEKHRKTIQNNLEIISMFIEKYCRSFLPILIQVANILSKPRPMMRRHICGKPSFSQAFSGDDLHECNFALIDHLFRYSIFLKNQKEYLNKILYTLFMYPTFKQLLVVKYLEHFRYSSNYKEDFEIGQAGHLYTQFFCKQQVVLFMKHISKENIFHDFDVSYKKLRSTEYEMGQKGIQHAILPVRFMGKRCRQFKLLNYSAKMLVQFLHLAMSNPPVEPCDKPMLQQRFILHYDNMLIGLFADYLGNLDSSNDSRSILMMLVEIYSKGVKKLQVTPKYYWHCQSQRFLSMILFTYLLHFGEDQTRNFIQSSISENILEITLSNILPVYNYCQKQLKSKQVGFLGEVLPRDIVRAYYRIPPQHFFDCQQLGLQMLAAFSHPEIFIRIFMENLLPENFEGMVISLICQESYAANVGSLIMKSHSLMENSTKLILLSLLNSAKSHTFKSIEQKINKSILNLQTVQIEQLLTELCDHNKEAGTFQIKSSFSGISDRILLKRNTALYSKFFEMVQAISDTEFQKDKLLMTQFKQKIVTLCWLVTKNLSQSVVFLSNFIFKFFRELWNGTNSQQKTALDRLKLIQACLIRGSNDQKFLAFVANENDYMKDKPQTNIQKILSHLLADFNLIKEKQQEKIAEVDNSKQSIAALKRKQMLEQMKKNQNQFLEQNKEALKEEPEEDKIEGSKCLICHSQTEEGLLVPLQSIRIQTLPNQSYRTYNSCYHQFHLTCLKSVGPGACPLCGFPIVSFIFEIYKNQKFLSVDRPDQRLRETQQITGVKKIELFFKMLTSEVVKEQMMPESPLTTFNEIIVAKLQSALLMSSDSFHNRLRPLIKSFFTVQCYFAHRLEALFKNENQKMLKTVVDSIDKELLPIVYNNKIQSYVMLIAAMIGAAYAYETKDVLKYYQSILKGFFNAFLACNLVSIVGRQQILAGQIETVYKLNRQAALLHMADFCRGVLYTFSIPFEKDYAQLLTSLDKDLSNAIRVVEELPNFFSVDFKLLRHYVQIHPESNNLFAQQPLFVRTKTIELPESYIEFHRKYYDTKCTSCHDYNRKIGKSFLLCLLCGHRQCEQCASGPLKQVLSAHAKSHHCSSAAFIDMDSNLVILTDHIFGLPYGALYASRFGQNDPEKWKDWSTMTLDRTKLSKIVGLLQKHGVLEELAFKTRINPQMQIMTI